VTLDEGGRPRINPILVDDVVRAMAALLPRDGHQLLNVAGDEVVSIRELAEAAGAALGREPQFEEGSPTAAGDLVADTTRLHEELPGLRPLASLAEGLRRMAAAST
jgi:nucleoside-diphosphate-sugar epimerase